MLTWDVTNSSLSSAENRRVFKGKKSITQFEQVSNMKSRCIFDLRRTFG